MRKAAFSQTSASFITDDGRIITTKDEGAMEIIRDLMMENTKISAEYQQLFQKYHDLLEKKGTEDELDQII